MPRPKIARKSTWVDMTAFCDVAFLLLSFFIMATKTKPVEAIQVIMPSSVSSKEAKLVDQVLVTLSKDGKVFIGFSENERRAEVVEEVGNIRGIKFPADVIKKAETTDFFGSAISQIPQYVNLTKEERVGDKLAGIPVLDSTNNELTDWMRAVFNVYRGGKMNLYIKGDNAAKYPAFKAILTAFKKNDFLKFSIITNSEGLPADSDLYIKEKKAGLR